MVLRLASTAVQHPSPQLQPKQPFFALMSFCSVTDSIFPLISRPFEAESFAGSSARCTAASWLLCRMETSASDV